MCKAFIQDHFSVGCWSVLGILGMNCELADTLCFMLNKLENKNDMKCLLSSAKNIKAPLGFCQISK